MIQHECFVREAKRVDYLLPLLQKLDAHAPYPVVSLNYDNVIELGCTRSGIRVAEEVLGERIRSCDVELVKLHGSVTWQPRLAMKVLCAISKMR